MIGFIQTGDHVDVIGGFNIDNGIDGKRIRSPRR